MPENSWIRTILHDKTHWRVLTICSASDMSWVYSTKRLKINWPERLDSREHQNWTRIGSHNQLPTRWTRSGNQNWICEQRQVLLVGQNFSCLEQNWSQTWSTTSATTTSRRPLQRRRKYLGLQADARQKQNREDLQLERTWIDIESEAQFDQAYPVAKRITTLLRHGELPREEDGASEFWRLKDGLRNRFEYSQYWSDDVWKSKMAGGGGNNKRFQYWTDPSGQEILYLQALSSRSFRTQSHWSYIAGQCVDSEQFLRVHLSCWMCSQCTHHHKFSINSGRTKI